MQRLFITALTCFICISAYSQDIPGALDDQIFDLQLQIQELQDSLSDLEDSLYSPLSTGNSIALSFGTLFPFNELFNGNLSSQSQSDLFENGGSWTVQITELWQYHLFDSPKVDLYIGNSFDFSRMQTHKHIDAFEGAIGVASIDSAFSVKSSSLNVGYFRIPILLHLGSSHQFNEKGFHCFIGIIPGIRYYGVLTSRLSNGVSKTRLVSRDFGLSRFQLNGRISLGIKYAEIFAETSLIPLFKKSETNPIVYPFKLGVSFVPPWN